MATVGDLYEELDETSGAPDAPDTISITELMKQDASQVMEYDRNNEDSIHSDTEILKNCLNACEDIIIAAFKLREYVPNMNDKNIEQAKFWKETVSRFWFLLHNRKNLVSELHCR